MNALHFIGFTADQYRRAVSIFGIPDFIHPGWDRRAAFEIIEGDAAVFAKGNINDAPRAIAYHEEER